MRFSFIANVTPTDLVAINGQVGIFRDERPDSEFGLLESEGNYTRVHFDHAHPQLFRSLNAMEERLARPELMQVRRSTSSTSLARSRAGWGRPTSSRADWRTSERR